MKKAIITVGAVVLAGSLMFIQPIQSLAVSALSIFRVENAKTIQITMTDIEELMEVWNEHTQYMEDNDEAKVAELFSSIGHQEQEPVFLQDINEFTAFRVLLPKELKDQQPVLTMVDSQTKSYTIDTDKINEMAAKAGILSKLNASYQDETIVLTTSPVLWAEYDNLRLMATQGAYLESPKELNQEIWNLLLELPGIPENIRLQLAEIDINARDIYLPVVMGVGREVELKGVTGYLYASADIAALIGALSDTATDGETTTEEINTLIWVKNNVLYCLSGNVSDDELAKIARSVK